jgi:hypothetical protein
MKKNQEAAGQADRQTHDVQEAVQFLSFDDPHCDHKIVFDHDGSPINGIPQKSRQGLEKHQPKPQDSLDPALRLVSIPVGLFEIPDNLMIIFLIQEKPQQGLS